MTRITLPSSRDATVAAVLLVALGVALITRYCI